MPCVTVDVNKTDWPRSSVLAEAVTPTVRVLFTVYGRVGLVTEYRLASTMVTLTLNNPPAVGTHRSTGAPELVHFVGSPFQV